MDINNKIKVLVVDDSAFMRKSISIMLESDPEIQVIGTARDGVEAIEQTKKLKPDIITLDVEMPRMDGLTALEKIMKECPTPVLMLSSLTTEGAETTVKALELGAVDFIAKELSFVSVNIVNIKDNLLKKVKEIVKHRKHKERLLKLQGLSLEQEKKYTPPTPLKAGQLVKGQYKAVALGISTGGPMSLQQVIPKLKADLNAPVFIVQHMPPKFTKSLADRLNSLSQLEVKEAENGEVVKNNVVYIAPGGYHMIFRKNGPNVTIEISNEPANTLHKPSVDVMVSSAVKVYGKNLLGVIMTGMGKDGFEGIKELKEVGGHAIAQDEMSCVVYGMPKAIVDADLADIVAPLDKIAEHINRVF